MKNLLRKSMFRLGLLILAIALAGCKTSSPSQYVSPRVTGRVVDSQTHQPIADVQVRRQLTDPRIRSMEDPKGGQLLEQAPAVRTGKDGTFVLDSVRDLSLFRQVGWYSVTLSFERRGYKRLTASYSLANSTNTAKGEPLVNTGDILLVPQAK